MICFYFTLCKYHHYWDYVDYTSICDNFPMLFKKKVAPAKAAIKKENVWKPNFSWNDSWLQMWMLGKVFCSCYHDKACECYKLDTVGQAPPRSLPPLVL